MKYRFNSVAYCLFDPLTVLFLQKMKFRDIRKACQLLRTKSEHQVCSSPSPRGRRRLTTVCSIFHSEQQEGLL